MTNREILNSPIGTLGRVDRQRQVVLQIEITPMPCPACNQHVNALDAAGIDIDAYDFGKTKHKYQCPACSAELEYIVPFVTVINPWQWQLKQTWIQEQMRKAKAFDEQTKPDADTHPS